MGSQNNHTKWPVEYFNKLAALILNFDPKVIIGLTGTNNEKYLLKGIDSHDSIIDFFGKFNIEELPYFIKQSDLLITNDTGILHLAIAVGTPTISLFGASKRSDTGPYQDLYKHQVIEKSSFQFNKKRKKINDANMRNISIEEVFDCYKKVMS